MSSSCEGARVDGRWKPLREGEMSPFKMLVTLFIREVYAVAATERKATEDRSVSPKTLLLIYNLISSYDLDSFVELKSILEKPVHAVRPEVLKKFNRIVSNLEPNNSYFLYELANSIVTMEASQMVVLKKRIAKNSPFGKFLRGIYLNVKKLSYPQVDFMYKQLLSFLGIPGEMHSHSQGKVGKDKRVLKGLDLFQKLEEKKNGEGLDLEVYNTYIMEYKKMTRIATESEKTSYDIHSDWKAAKAKSAAERALTLRKLWTLPHLKVKAENEEDLPTTAITPIPMPCDNDGVLDKRDVHKVKSARRSPRSQPEVSVKRITRSSSSPIGKGGKTTKRRSSSLRRIYFSSPRPTSQIGSSTTSCTTSTTMTANTSVTHSPGRTTRSSVVAGTSKSPFSPMCSPFLSTPAPSFSQVGVKTKLINTGAFKIRMRVFPNSVIQTTTDGSSTSKIEGPSTGGGKSRIKKVSIMKMSSDEDDFDDDDEIEEDEHHDVVMKSPSPVAKSRKHITTPSSSHRGAAVSKKRNTPIKLSSTNDNMTRATSSSSQSIINQPGQSPQLAPLSQPPITPGKILRNTKLETKLKLGSTTTPVSKSAMTVPTYGSDQYDKQWHVIKHWSRKQIERSVKGLINRLYSANCSVPSPAEISQFVRLALTNPSSSVLYPHLHYLEYLNSLRVKDVARCTDSLRASFDVRIKPNTTEINKGTTYAPYNAAIFYHQLGYKDDALSSLNEAFRSGHAAGDATCLHHCHNLWSCFHSKAYTDAIVTVTKEVDNNMAYLHSLNVIVNAFDVHSRGIAPDEVLHSLWHYNADCDLEEMEGLLLSALSNFYTIFGWHAMIAFPAEMILYTNWKWSSRFYAFALCCLSQCLLYHGDVNSSIEIMEYGQGIFGFDASPAGQNFILQYAIFEAIRSYLSYEPVSSNVIATIISIDEIEGVYWKGYNLMIRNNWRDANKLFTKFLVHLDDKEQSKSYMRTDLKLRCLLLLAELECLCRNPAGSVTYLSDALDIAATIHSDVYTTLCLYNSAAVQNRATASISDPTVSICRVLENNCNFHIIEIDIYNEIVILLMPRCLV
ncbi:uncharacterized protein LOC110844850 isoform X2 [Folsomia candida]|uniref:uncharacterized protein LOC110844850 isoform X2 n=1 Tax=Folsomia candida TaxID=158441 RepID=UPI0016051D15|nr:uncharacterized protein LOC110844850 isoform X2 [Folsomia candida]